MFPLSPLLSLTELELLGTTPSPAVSSIRRVDGSRVLRAKTDTRFRISEPRLADTSRPLQARGNRFQDLFRRVRGVLAYAMWRSSAGKNSVPLLCFLD